MDSYVAFFEKHEVSEDVLKEAVRLRDEWSRIGGLADSDIAIEAGNNHTSTSYLYRVIRFSGYFINLKNWVEETFNVDLTDEQLRKLPDSVDVNWRFDAVINYVIYRKNVFIVK